MRNLKALYFSGTAIKKAAKSGELPPQPAKPQQQQQAPAPAPAALAVPQVAICPATPAVNEQELIVSSQKQTSSSTVMSSSSSSTTVQQQGGGRLTSIYKNGMRTFDEIFYYFTDTKCFLV